MNLFVGRAVETAGGSGLKWVRREKLTDLNFADDVVMTGDSALSWSATNLTSSAARTTGLHINAEKTKSMKNARLQFAHIQQLKFPGRLIERVGEF